MNDVKCFNLTMMAISRNERCLPFENQLPELSTIQGNIFLVHRHMVQKRMELTRKWNEIRKCRRDLLWFIHRLEVCIERKLNPGAVIPLSFY